MTTWPTILPQSPLADSFRETLPDNLLRTDMDQGPAKTRKRSGAAPRLLSMQFLMSKSQVAALDDFFNNDAGGGALSFAFIHPRTNVSINCRFLKPPAISAINGVFFKIGVELEALA